MSRRSGGSYETDYLGLSKRPKTEVQKRRAVHNSLLEMLTEFATVISGELQPDNGETRKAEGERNSSEGFDLKA